MRIEQDKAKLDMEQSSFHPSLYELERAILLYTSPIAKSSLKEWQGMDWLWERLNWTARLVSHFGAISLLWWKERYLFPIICQAGIPCLQRLLAGEWVRAEEESLRYCFHFFVPYSKKDPALFPEDVSQFLSGVCPSFNTERDVVQSRLVGKGGARNCGWFRDETFAHYRARMHSFFARESVDHVQGKEKTKRNDLEERFEAISEATREKAKRCINEIVKTREDVADLSAIVDLDFGKAFPIRQEIEGLFSQLNVVKEESFTLLLSIDDLLMRLSDGVAASFSDTETKKFIAEAERAFLSVRSDAAMLRRKNEQLRAMIEGSRGIIMKRIQALTSLLDHVPMLEPANPFRIHQIRLVKIGREKLKRFRLSLTRCPGPELFIDQLEHEVEALSDLARRFYDEGTEISSMKEQLHCFEHQIQGMLDEASSVNKTASLHNLLTEVLELKRSLEVASDRKAHFDHIVQSVHAFEL